MDEVVKAAIAKWPNVPAVFGWLSLNGRGDWRIKDDPIDNEAINEFIGRNYMNDGCGNWFFQNGPQRVYVSLEIAPWIYRLDEFKRLATHTGTHPRELRQVFADESGRLYFETELGPGVLDDRDTLDFANRIVDEEGRPLDETAFAAWNAGQIDAELKIEGLHVNHDTHVRIERIKSSRVPEVLGFMRKPQSSKRC
jgi:Protein of unknown function (DUF2946)